MDSTYLDPYYTDPPYFEILSADPDIGISQTLRNGYSFVAFDCEQFPTNITEFRRAFAFAFNKTKVIEEVMNGFAITHDSIVPSQNEFCIEDDLEYHYYDARPDLGNAILDDLGFAINHATGFRQAPNGHPIHILILYGMGLERYERIAEICIETFSSLNISASSTEPCFPDLYPEMIVWHQQFSDSDLSWLAYQYWSECPDDYYLNTYYHDTGFSNTTFDSWREQILNSPSFEDTFEAASHMQEILHYNVPLIPIYQDIQLYPYRTDQYGGHIEDTVNSIMGPWTMLGINKLDGATGGSVPIGISNEPIFNFWRTGAKSGHWFFTNLHYGLYTRGPDQLPYPQLAKSVIIETHLDNPTVIEGNTRFTFEIREDVEWTDDIPVTIDDVVFTFNYMRESQEFGNPTGSILSELSALYSPRPGVVVFEFSTESYWLFERFAYDFIVPKHIFSNYAPEEWADWDLITNDDGNSLNCGPFLITDFEENEFYELSSRNPYSNTDILHGTMVALLQPVNDASFSSSSFTLRWEIDWELHWFDNQIAKDGRFNMLWSPAYSTYSYTVFLDGENYLVGTGGGTASWINFIDVNIDLPSPASGEHNVTLVLDNGYYAPQVDIVIVKIIYPISPVEVIIKMIIGVSASVIVVVALAILWNTRIRPLRPRN